MKRLVAAGISSWCGRAARVADARPQARAGGSRRRGGPGVARAALASGARARIRAGDAPANDPAESLRRWLSRTETLISWSESTRSDWDRHLRPMLARQFGIATGQKQNKDPEAFRATGRMLFGDELWAWVDPENVVPHRQARTRARAVRARRNSATVGAGMTAPFTAGSDDHRPLRGGARRDRTGRGRQALGAHADSHHRARPRPCADRGSSRPRQDVDCPVLRRRAGTRVHPRAVHARPAARGSARLDRLRHAVGALRVPPGADLHQPAARRRDQPDAAQDPGRAAGGDGRGPGEHRRRHPPAARRRSSSWPPTTRSSTRAPIRCPRRSWTASRSGSNCGICRSRRRPRCCAAASNGVRPSRR